MKTAKEKAYDFLREFVGEWTAKQERELIKLLKEQDRDTRHACAEAVNRIALDHNAISQAHNTVMNTKAV